MQPTDVQVQASLVALAVDHDDGRASTRATPPRPSPRDLRALPAGLLDALRAVPSLREDRLVAVRRRLAAGIVPTDEALAGRMVGRIVCDRLR